MNSSHEYIANIANRIMHAKVHFEIWDELQQRRAEDDWVGLNRPYWMFMRYTIQAHFVAYITELYSVMERRSDTINLHLLVEPLLKAENSDETKVEELKTEFASAKALWKKVCILRNNHVGHVSAKRELESTYELANITPNEIEDFIDLLMKVCNVVSRMNNGTKYKFNLSGVKSTALISKKLAQ